MANSCETCKHYEVESYNEPCNSCRFRDYDVPTKWESPFNKQKTNADRIRAMSDEELADIMSMHTATGACNDWGIPHKKCGGNCRECIIKWLKQPAEEK